MADDWPSLAFSDTSEAMLLTSMTVERTFCVILDISFAIVWMFLVGSALALFGILPSDADLDSARGGRFGV
ncbi:MAG: hypothetical protein LBS45_03420 [Synergistaceae bacterium]|nr:hypothetical protein [Synergistaceae bacterium]